MGRVWRVGTLTILCTRSRSRMIPARVSVVDAPPQKGIIDEAYAAGAAFAVGRRLATLRPTRLSCL